MLCGAPAVVAAILDAARTWDGPIPGRDRVRMVVAGAPPPTRTIERMETELGWEFIQIYGLTETAPLLTMNRGRAEYDDLSPAVAEACVIGVPDDKWGETVKALVVLKPGQVVGEDDLIEHCRKHLAHFKCPTSVEYRDEFARTSTGKLQKFKIRAPYWEGRER